MVARAEKTYSSSFSHAFRTPLAVPQQPDVAKACVTTARATHVPSRRPLDGEEGEDDGMLPVRKTTPRSRSLSYTSIRAAVVIPLLATSFVEIPDYQPKRSPSSMLADLALPPYSPNPGIDRLNSSSIAMINPRSRPTVHGTKPPGGGG